MSASSPHDRRWLCLFTQPHRERLALASLREDGFEVYLPLYSKSVLRNGKRTSMKAPLFPRYLFVAGADDAAFFSAARHTSEFAGKNPQSFSAKPHSGGGGLRIGRVIL